MISTFSRARRSFDRFQCVTMLSLACIGGLTPVLSNADHTQLYQLPAFQAKPIPSQVPGVNEPHEGHLHVALWANGQAEIATLEFDVDPRQLQNLTLRCAPAGQEGAVVWDAAGREPGFQGRRKFSITSGELVPHVPDEVCPATINNLMSLHSAGARRLLYVEFERDGRTHRGQLWTRASNLQAESFTSWANLSDQQIIQSRPQEPQWQRQYVSLQFEEFTGDLDEVRYGGPKYGTVSLHCGLPGVEGPLLTNLASRERILRNENITPTSGDGACGVVINNIASLLEALLRGRIYAQLVSENGQSIIRGQFLTPEMVF